MSNKVTVEKDPTAIIREKYSYNSPNAATINNETKQFNSGSYGEEPEENTVIDGRYSKVPDIDEAPAPIKPLQPNVLEQYTSYNYLFTLACLTNEEVSQPERTYRKQPFKKPIIRSAGGLGSNKVQTVYEKQGRFEYFIDNVSIDSIIIPTNKTRNTNATTITFDVYEPYSMGLFLQTLQISAQPEYENYLAAPFMLKVEFVGYDDENLNPRQIPNSTRYFPLKLTKVDFNVDQNGSRYSVQGIPWNEQALSDVIQSTKTDISITGKDLVELLQVGPKSLASVLNTRLLEQEKAKQVDKADEIIIVFPDSRTSENYLAGGTVDNNQGATTLSSTDSNATGMQKEYDEQEVWESLGQNPNAEIPEDFDAYASKILGFVIRRSNLSESIKSAQENGNINDIGKSKMLKGANTPGAQPFGFAKYEYDTDNKVWKSGGVTISSDFRDFTFPRGTKIEKIIEELILVSDYGRRLSKALLSDVEGFIDWFRIETQVYPVPNKAQAAKSGRPPMIYVYRVLPYKVHSSVLLAPTKPGVGYDRLKQEAAKVYNYIYTGLNKDIVDFDIQLNNAFFTGLSADADALASDNVQGGKVGTKPEEQETFSQNEGGSQTSQKGVSRTEFVNETNTGRIGGAGYEDTETRVARTFHEAITNSQADLLSLNMTIIGDPYYIADSGMGNYNSRKTQYINITADGGMNYQDSEVDVVVNFRTPLDYNPQGQMDFPEDTVPINSFSGLYRVLQVRNMFESGQFKQELQLIRRRNQDENVDQATADSIAAKVQATPEQKSAQAEILARVPSAEKVQQESGSF